MSRQCHVFRTQGKKEGVWVSSVPQDPMRLTHSNLVCVLHRSSGHLEPQPRASSGSAVTHEALWDLLEESDWLQSL